MKRFKKVDYIFDDILYVGIIEGIEFSKEENTWQGHITSYGSL